LFFFQCLSGGKIIIRPYKNSEYPSEMNTIIGNVALYGATSGTLQQIIFTTLKIYKNYLSLKEQPSSEALPVNVLQSGIQEQLPLLRVLVIMDVNT
jgi:hypothetical protein